MKWGKPPPKELLKQHANSKWHKDAAVAAIMAQQAETCNVFELQCSGAAKELAEQKQESRSF